jgi:hypothetical protein
VLFGLLDRVAAELGVAQIDGVVVNSSFNAFARETARRERWLGIGAPLWLSLARPARLALLGHELAHFVHDNSARSGVTGAAQEILVRWAQLFRPPLLVDHGRGRVIVRDDRSVAAEAMTNLLGRVVELVALGYQRLVHTDLQRAEYLADRNAARVAGAPAVLDLLDVLVRAPLAYGALTRLHIDGSRAVPVFAAMAEAVRSPMPEAAARLRAEVTAERHTIDETHPPTAFRMSALAEATGAPRVVVEADEWARIAAELAGAIAAAEESLLDELAVQ